MAEMTKVPRRPRDLFVGNHTTDSQLRSLHINSTFWPLRSRMDILFFPSTTQAKSQTSPRPAEINHTTHNNTANSPSTQRNGPWKADSRQTSQIQHNLWKPKVCLHPKPDEPHSPPTDPYFRQTWEFRPRGQEPLLHSLSLCLLPASRCSLSRLILGAWRRRRYVPPK
jgi:hypothetical protein